jgi:hypothetical protein
MSTPLLNRLDELAEDVGRLRRRPSDEYGARLVDRISFDIEALEAMVASTAAEIAQAIRVECGGDLDVAVEEALRIVDERVERLRRRLGVAVSGPIIRSTRPAAQAGGMSGLAEVSGEGLEAA